MYGFGFHKAGFITMLLIREWMTKHLDEKAQIREQLIEERKQDRKITDESFDAKRFYEEGAKFREAQKENELKRNSFSFATYEAIKHNYFSNEQGSIQKQEHKGHEGTEDTEPGD